MFDGLVAVADGGAEQGRVAMAEVGPGDKEVSLALLAARQRVSAVEHLDVVVEFLVDRGPIRQPLASHCSSRRQSVLTSCPFTFHVSRFTFGFRFYSCHRARQKLIAVPVGTGMVRSSVVLASVWVENGAQAVRSVEFSIT